MKNMQLICLLAFAMVTALNAAETQTPTYPFQIQKDPKIVVEPDQTDIFAIPLDEDAEDDEILLYKLQHPNEDKKK